MLTPIFELKQDSDTVTVIIKAPFIKVSETEVFFEDNDFKFYSKPYFLRLNLPGEVVQDVTSKASYDSDNGYFNIVMAKKCSGQHFDGLDMMAQLLQPRGNLQANKPQIEVLGEQNDTQDSDDEEFDWQIPQEVPSTEPLISFAKYGFANQRSGIIQGLQTHLTDLFDLKDRDSKTWSQVRAERLASENQKFSSEHYLADLYDDEAIQQLKCFEPPWTTYSSDKINFTDDERLQMVGLPRRDYVLEKLDKKCALLGLVDIILCYAYNVRTTEGENTVESAWTIRKLSAMLCWLDSYEDLKDVFVTFTRRSLIYPLYRNWELSMAIIRDCIKLFRLGQKMILKCVLEIHSLLKASDPHYVLNDLYITDYCIWIQLIKPSAIADLISRMIEISISKEDVDLNLHSIEEAARKDEQSLEDRLAAVSIQDSRPLDSDDDSSSCDSSYDDSTSDSSSSDETDSDDESSNDGDTSSFNTETSSEVRK